MFIFGVCVGPTESFAAIAKPGLDATMEDGDELMCVEGASSIFCAYNEIIIAARSRADVEAVVLLHDDVQLQDINFHARIRRIARQPDVGVVGVVGHRGMFDLRYWLGRPGFGRAWDSGGPELHGPLRGEVDSVDGLLMVLLPPAFESIDFDSVTYDGFLGYDADYCFACREQGLRVMVEPIALFHRSTGSPDTPEFASANAAFSAKWHQRLGRRPLEQRFRSLVRIRRRLRKLDRETRLIRAEAGRLAKALSQRARRRTAAARPEGATADSVAPSPAPPTELPDRCVACGGRLSLRKALPIAKCLTCGSFTTHPHTEVDETSTTVFDVAYAGQRRQHQAQWNKEAHLRLAWIESVVPEGVLVDIGSATGELTTAAIAAGFDAHGIEPSRTALEEPYEGLFAGDFDAWCREFDCFRVDAVTAFHVLEHLPDPAAFLNRAASILSTAGHVFIEVPNAGSKRAQAEDPEWGPWQFQFHRWHFTAEGLMSLIEAQGLEVIEIHEFSLRVYTDNRRYETLRARERATADPPAKDLLRVIARATGRS